MSVAALEPEEQARANFYALLARLLSAPPDRELLRALSAAAGLEAEGEPPPLAQAWGDLVAAAAQADPEAVREEYESAFVGTGKAEVTLYGCAYLEPQSDRNPLVEIREFLAAHGLQRRNAVHEPEDHIAALCEVMRHLIERQDAAVQRDFFARFLARSADRLCDAIIQCERLGFYRSVARFRKIFFALEHS